MALVYVCRSVPSEVLKVVGQNRVFPAVSPKFDTVSGKCLPGPILAILEADGKIHLASEETDLFLLMVVY